MAYQKKYDYKKKKYRRKYKKANSTGWVGVARKALRTAKYVATLVNAEYKYVEKDISHSANYSGDLQGPLNDPVQDVSVNGRTGDSIKCKNLTLKGSIQRGTADSIARLIVVWDKEGSMNAGSELLEDTGTGYAVFANKNQVLKYDSKILYDKLFTLTSNAPIKLFNIKINIGQHTNFTPGSTTVTNGALRTLVISNLAAASGEPSYSYHSHVTYLDN